MKKKKKKKKADFGPPHAGDREKHCLVMAMRLLRHWGSFVRQVFPYYTIIGFCFFFFLWKEEHIVMLLILLKVPWACFIKSN